MSRSQVRLAALLAAVAVGGIAAWFVLGDDLDEVRRAVVGAGAWGWLVLVVLHVVLSLVPVPRSLLAAVSGALFGVAGGIALSYGASLVAAALAFGIARRVGREAVEGLTGPRIARAERLLRNQGLVAVVVARLTPVAPFFATNYAAGISAVRGRDYAIGSLAGLAPGSIAWATVGASADADSTTLLVAASVAALLLVAAVLVGRRLGTRATGGASPG